jgi:hypothetical protein
MELDSDTRVTVRETLRAAREYLVALTDRTRVETTLLSVELAKMTQEVAAERKKTEPKGMMRNPYGFCPKCGEIGVSRNRNGVDICLNGHEYPSSEATLAPMIRELPELP